MAVREEDRRGKRILVLDIGYRKPDGSWARYRRDSEAATKTAAREEERRIRDRIAKTGSPFDTPPPPPPPEPTLCEAPCEPSARSSSSYQRDLHGHGPQGDHATGLTARSRTACCSRGFESRPCNR